MAELSIAITVVAILIAVSFWADRRFCRHDRLPMQWSAAGKVNWTAPRRAALAFTPVLGVLMLGGTATLLARGPLGQGRGDVGVSVLVVMGVGLLMGHLLHLWLIERSLR